MAPTIGPMVPARSSQNSDKAREVCGGEEGLPTGGGVTVVCLVGEMAAAIGTISVGTGTALHHEEEGDGIGAPTSCPRPALLPQTSPKG